MPILKEQIAKTTGFQANCGLSGLAHVLVKNIDEIPETSLETLCDTFNQYYETDLELEEFKQAIQIKNPVHLEIVLGPVLREMLGNADVVGEEISKENKAKGVNKPGYWLDHVDVMHLANFFEIWVESYTAFEVRAREILVRKGNRKPTLEQIKQEAEELRRIHGLNREFELDCLEAYEQEQNDKVFADREENAPILKLWNQGGGHFEYEEDDEDAANEHNEFYDPNNRYIYQSDEAEAVRLKIKGKIYLSKNAGVQREIIFSEILTEYEEEHSARQSRRSADQANPFAEFSKLFEGEGFSTDIGKGIFQAFTAPFVDADGEPNLGFKPSSDGWMGIFEGIIHFGVKIFQVMQGLTSVVGGIFGSMQPQQASGGVPYTDSMEEGPSELGTKFADAAHKLGGGNIITADSQTVGSQQSPVLSQFGIHKQPSAPVRYQVGLTTSGEPRYVEVMQDQDDEVENHENSSSGSSSRSNSPDFT